MWNDLVDAWKNAPGRSESADEYRARRKEIDDAKFQAILKAKREGRDEKFVP
jgi:hypothetical protein